MAALLKITPSVIEFPVVLDQSITSTLRLENVSKEKVTFKIKTTAPKSYLVRPSTGVVAAGSFQEVLIILQPLNAEPTGASTDRFLVQAALAPDGNIPSREFWSSLPKTEVSDQRFGVVFKREFDNGDAGGVFRMKESDGSGTGSIPADYDQLAAEHELLQKNFKFLESEKARLERDLDNMRERLRQAVDSQNGGWAVDTQVRSKLFGLELWHLIPVVLLAFVFFRYVWQ
eukprot:CAMPEP_0113847358 /NCGR_PEP_ID=MMETSP0372-20130328/1828_1 /TAXON_ID=340204 /ORGANISM="Lankesteria abbotti" /LENGTH=229 /DNA_ID=CAMNT_0000816623 /DNA_START=99 /DNA_END=785 /DNA_ORIENTATION=- /assembly_acc=CAM_ASM_000359